MDETSGRAPAEIMGEINRTWLSGRVNDLAPLLHPEIAMIFPGFSGRIRGREEFLAGFREFCENCRIHEFREEDQTVDVVSSTAIVSFRYQMKYERSGQRYQAAGRDLWVFEYQNKAWIAVWRTMLEMTETAL